MDSQQHFIHTYLVSHVWEHEWVNNTYGIVTRSPSVHSVSWVRYKRRPLEGTLAAWSKPSTSSADTRSGPWTWAMRKVLMCWLWVFPFQDLTACLWCQLPLCVCVCDRMHPGLCGVRGQPHLRAGAGNLLRLLHGAHRPAASSSRQSHYSGIQPGVCRDRSPSHFVGRSGRKGKVRCLHTNAQSESEPDNLARHMTCFLNPLDLSQVSICWRSP